MLSRRTVSQSGRLLSHSTRRTYLRSAPRRRYATETSPRPEHIGPADNPFNRERLAAQEHAAGTAALWRRLTFYIALPAIIIASANTYTLWSEHEEHLAHGPPLEDRVEYSYMNIRTKSFPWGDGDKTLFWNDKYNYHKKD